MVSYIEGDGNFGTPLQHWQDAAASRYTHMKGSRIARLLWPPTPTVQPDGSLWAVVPLVLVTGVKGGIATGFACEMAPHHYKDVISLMRWGITGEQPPLIGEKLVPFYPQWKGTVRPNVAGGYVTQGSVEVEAVEGTYQYEVIVTELPAGASVPAFKTKIKESEAVLDVTEAHGTHSIRFILEVSSETEPTAASLGLVSNVSENRTIVRPNGLVVAYDNDLQFVKDFVAHGLPLFATDKLRRLEELRIKCAALAREIQFLLGLRGLGGINAIFGKSLRDQAELIASATPASIPAGWGPELPGLGRRDELARAAPRGDCRRLAENQGVCPSLHRPH